MIRTGQTVFEAASRLESVAGSPLTARGAADVQATARQMAGQNIEVVYAAGSEGEAQTAALVAEVLGIKVRIADELHEIDYGLWQGLTTTEIKRRQPKLYRQWNDAPTTVRPPGGETLVEARQRIRDAVRTLVKRHKNRAPLMVLPPVAVGLLLCVLAEADTDTIWRQMDPDFTWSSYEMGPEAL